MVGQLINAAVVRALIFGTESRLVTGKTTRKWQCFINGIARYACRQKLSDMQENRVTLPVAASIGAGQLRYLGHVARLPADRPEKCLLYAWLPRESLHPSYKGATCSRHVFWQRITELLALTDLPRSDWHNKWEELAQKQGGTVWNSLVRKWTKQQVQRASLDTWNARHSNESRAGRQRAAAERAYAELGVHRCPDGRHQCGHEGCNAKFSLRGMRQHVPVCKNLSPEQRLARGNAAAAPSAEPEPRDRRPRAALPVRRRLAGKQPRPPAFVRPATAASSADIAACTAFSPSEVHAHYESLHLTRRYRGLYLHRPISLTDLPCPNMPAGFSCLSLDNNTHQTHAMLCFNALCGRCTLLKQRNRTCPCVHCGSLFTVPKAAGRHSVECAKRRKREGLPLNLRQWFDLASEPVL